MARRDKDSPWVQIESILDSESDAAEKFISDLGVDDETRCSFIEDAEGNDWGKNAPKEAQI